MGSKGGAPMSSQSVVCCMCGDHGLSRELFRCKICLVRSQHKYCSDLYPKAESYRACNWCLREEGGKSLARESTSDQSPSSSNQASNNKASNNGGNGNNGVKLHRGAFESHLNKPIKKQRLPEKSASDVSEKMRSEELSPSLGRTRQVFRGKVRRYKLLEEVSS